MAYNNAALDTILVGGHKVHRYETSDTGATAIAAGYFNGARDASRISAGDSLILVTDTGGTRKTNLAVFQAVPASGNVTIVQAATIA